MLSDCWLTCMKLRIRQNWVKYILQAEYLLTLARVRFLDKDIRTAFIFPVDYSSPGEDEKVSRAESNMIYTTK